MGLFSLLWYFMFSIYSLFRRYGKLLQIPGFDYPKIISNLIQKNIENLCKGIYKKGEETYKQHITDTGSAFEKYLNSSVKRFNNVKTIIHNHKPVPLHEFYVDINIKCGKDIINTEHIENILSYSNFITIFGSGGTGKSTLFKHLFLDTIVSTDLIPIFIELKDFNDKNYENIEDLIFESLMNLNFSLEKEFFINSLKNNKYVFFLDGYDEVKEEKKTLISKEIIRITNKYRNNYYLVSSRKNTMLERGWDNFCDFTMEPLTREKSIELIKNLTYDEELKRQFLVQLQTGRIFNKHKSFCSNPLLLTIMLLAYQDFAEIPDKLHIFYGRAFDVLYSRHDATKGSFVREKRLEKQGLASDDFKSALSTFSAISYSDSKIAFEFESLIEYIQQAKNFTGLQFDSKDFLIDLTEAVCILTLDGSEYKYQHRSFQEYFTAMFINNLTDDEQNDFLKTLLDMNPNSLRGDSIFSMLFEMNQTKLEKNFLIPLLEELKLSIYDTNEQKMCSNFVNNQFSNISIDYFPNRKFHYTIKYQVKDSSSIKYSNLIHFVVKSYILQLGDIPKGYIKYPSMQQIQKSVKKIYNNESNKQHYTLTDGMRLNRVTINVEDGLHKPQICQHILMATTDIHNDLKLALYILDKLKEKYKERKSLNVFWKKNKS